MRTFLAINFKHNKEQFQEIQKRFSEFKIKFVKEFHLTLIFFGEITESKADEIKSKLENLEFREFPVRFSNLGVFPNENFARVLWLGVDNSDEIMKLKEQVDSILGWKDKRFHPHLTLGRIKNIEDKGRFISLLKGKMEPIETVATGIELIKSTLTPEGPIYETLATFDF